MTQEDFVIRGIPSMGTLVALRESMGLTQEVMAARMGFRQNRLSVIESGTDVRIATLEAYVRALGGRLAFRTDDPALMPLSEKEQQQGVVVHVARAVRVDGEQVGNLWVKWYGGTMFEVFAKGNEVVNNFTTVFPPATLEAAKAEARQWWTERGREDTKSLIREQMRERGR